MQKLKSRTNWIAYLEVALVLLFLVGIVAPGLSLLLPGKANQPGTPKRAERAPFPKLGFDRATLTAFPAGFKAYMRDNFGLRQTLIYGQAAFKYYCLDVSASPSVILGAKDGWLFYSDDASMVSLRNSKPLTNAELAQWATVLTARNAMLAQQDIKYLVVIAPDKHTIYPEYVPAAYSKMHEKSRREQLVEYLKANSNVTVLDLTDALRQAKPAGLLYLQTDTHWNSKGGFYAYQAIGQQLHHWFPQFQPRPLAAFRFGEYPFSGSDLSWMLGLQNGIQEIIPFPIPNIPFKAQPLNADALEHLALLSTLYKPVDIRVTQAPAAELSKAVVLCDSFADAISVYFAEHLGQTVYLQSTYRTFPADYLKQSRPQLVIQEFVERFLAGEAPVLP